MIPTLTHRKKLSDKKSSSKESLLQDKDTAADGAASGGNNVEENKTKRKIPVLKTRPKSQILSSKRKNFLI